MAVGACGSTPSVGTTAEPDGVLATQPAVPTTAPVVEPVVRGSDAAQPTAIVVPRMQPSPVATPSNTVSAGDPTVSPEADRSGSPDEPAPTEPVVADGAGSQPEAFVDPTATSPPVAGNVSQAALAANGAEVFSLVCARCHAENGQGTSGPYGASLIGVGARYSSAGLIDELTSGHRVTFGFADRLSADEIAAVAAYVKAAFG